MDNFSEAKAHGADLIGGNSSLHSMQKEMDMMINMDWKNKPSDPSLKITISPEARNQYLGAMRLLTASEPIISVPHDKNDAVSSDNSEKIERMCKAVLYQSGRINQKPVHYDLVGSLLRYGQFHLAVTDTEDLVNSTNSARKGASKARRLRYERIAKSTPYIFQPLDPKCGNAEFDSFGLRAYYRESSMTYAQLKGIYGEIEELKNRSDTDIVTYKDYWNLDVHFAWVDNISEPLIGSVNNGKHDLPCIPIIVQGAEGFLLQDAPEYQFQSLLYAVWKGELWDRHNLELTAMYSNLFAVASNAMFVHQRSEPDSQVEVDFDNIGGIVHLNPGDSLQPLQRDVLNKDMLYGLEVVQKMFEESTIYKTALGQGGAGNSAYSTIALLTQSGRLPLVASQKCGGWGIGSGLELMFDMLRDKNSPRTAFYEGSIMDIDPKELPDNLVIDVQLDAELPQDKLQQANIASMLKQQMLASDEWIRENILNVGQSKEMTKKIMEERFVDTMTKEYFDKAMHNQVRQEVMQELQQQMEQQQAQAQQQQAMIQQQQMAMQARQAQEGALGPETLYRTAMSSAQEQQRRYGSDNSMNPNMGGMPPLVAQGAIPASRPGMKPTPANGMPQELQEGEM